MYLLSRIPPCDSTPLMQLILLAIICLTSSLSFSPIGPAASTNHNVLKMQCRTVPGY